MRGGPKGQLFAALLASSLPIPTPFPFVRPMATNHLRAILSSCGVSNEAVAYLEARGLISAEVFAECVTFSAGSGTTEFTESVIKPFLDGFKDDADTEHKHVGDPMKVSAALRAAWKASHAPPPTSLPGGAPASTPGVVDNNPLGKTKTALLPGEFRERVLKWEALWPTAQPRRFPQELLLGADLILARILHEDLVSKQYSPTGLGEILQLRGLTATGT